MILLRAARPLLLLAAALSLQAATAAGEPVQVTLETAQTASGVRATLTFSRPVEYRLEETRARLRVLVPEHLVAAGTVEQDLDSDVMRRIRLDLDEDRSEIVFYLSRRFATFSTSELPDPFRVILQFQAEGSVAEPLDGGPPGGPAGPGNEPAEAQGDEPALRDPGAGRIVIDPGHGGSETGAVSRSGLKEKDLVLDISNRLKARLEQDGYVVSLTRDADESLDLTRRSALANQARADAFLSIHANSSIRTRARGAETYFLSRGDGPDDEAAALARQENQASGQAQAEDDLQLVLWEMAQTAHLSRSSRLGELIQSEMNSLAGTQDRGVKQAPFRVLVGAAMPAVLVEVGFLTHEEEEKQLASESYRQQIAEALAAAVRRFREETLREDGVAGSAFTGPPR